MTLLPAALQQLSTANNTYPRTADMLFHFHVTIRLVKLELILEDG